MTYILDRLNSEDDTGRVEQLEAELESVRNAFEEYISTTEGLEDDVKKDLYEMQNKLNYSTKANALLTDKLRSMNSLFGALELTSKTTRENLKTETKLRRQVEKTLTETELELRSKIVRIRQLERNDSSTLRIVDSGVITEMVNNTSEGCTDRELGTVTDELITTQEKLWKAEEQLERSQSLVQNLERNLQSIDNKTPQNEAEDDKELLRELDEIRAEIDATRSDIQLKFTDIESDREQVSKYKSQLRESQEENSKLTEEVICLRNLLHDHGITGINEVKEVHQIKIRSLRKQMEETIDENIDLQEKVKKLEIVSSSKKMINDENIKLQEEVNRLRGDILLAQNDDEGATREVRQRKDAHQEKIGAFDPREKNGTIEDEIIGIKFANDMSTCAEDMTIEEKLKQAERGLKESKEECSEMRFEILDLTESLYNAHQRPGEALSLNEESINTSSSKGKIGALLRAQNEVEDKKREISMLENSLFSTQEEVRLLSEEISFMSSAFKKAQDEYNSVVEELQQIEIILAAAKDSKFSQEIEMKRLESVAETTPQKNAEICFLKAQFEKLNEKNKNLARQVKDVESEILSVRKKQEKTKADTRARDRVAKDLRDDIDRSVSVRNQQNREVDKLAMMIENRIDNTERSIETVRSEIVVATRILERKQLSSLGKTYEQSMPAVLRKDYTPVGGKSVDNNLKKVTGEGEEVFNKSRPQLNFEQSEHHYFIDEKITKLKTLSIHGKSEDELNEKDRTAITAASLSTNSMYSKKNQSKYDEIMQRVSKYESVSTCSRENRELEARGDIGIEKRE